MVVGDDGGGGDANDIDKAVCNGRFDRPLFIWDGDVDVFVVGTLLHEIISNR